MHRVRPLPKKRKKTDNENNENDDEPCDFCNEFYIYIQKLFLNS
jgi:hypothetical protein